MYVSEVARMGVSHRYTNNISISILIVIYIVIDILIILVYLWS